MKSVLQTAALLALGSVNAADWDYKQNGKDWPAAECVNGPNQSPIDLNLDPAMDKYPRVSGDQFTKEYNNQGAVNMAFNGHTSQLNFDAKNGKMQFTS